MQKANGGGIGYIGASDNSYWDEDYWWGVGGGKAIVAAGPEYDASKIGAYDGIFHDHSEPANQQSNPVPTLVVSASDQNTSVTACLGKSPHCRNR